MSRTTHKRRRNTKESKSTSQSRDRLQLIAFERQDWHKKELTKERRNKRRSRSDRWRFVLGAPRVDLEEISITIVDAGKYIHYPASINDIARVTYSLPAEMLEGLTAIELCLGAEYQEEFLYKEEISCKPDPFVGRCGWEVLPGVFSGVSLGNYSRSPATIRLFAYVCDPAVPNREITEPYLRLEMLKQFVWQVARHHHFTAQLARTTGEDSESYARRIVGELMQQCVIPYLQQAYPEAMGAVEVW